MDRLAYSIPEVARLLGLSQGTVRALVEQKKLRAVRSIRKLLIPAEELQRFLADEPEETTIATG